MAGLQHIIIISRNKKLTSSIDKTKYQQRCDTHTLTRVTLLLVGHGEWRKCRKTCWKNKKSFDY